MNSIQPIEEFGGEGNMTITGYMIQVDRPQTKPEKPHIIFRIEAENTEYGEQGENLHFYEVKHYK